MPSEQGKIRYAVVGLGWFAQAAVLPAFKHARENSQLVALVSGDAEKRAQLARKYKAKAYSYDDYPRLMASGEVDAVYIVSPNTEHHPHTMTAAEHGVHVLCEKPLAATSDACREMIEACERNNAYLMTAYRLHFEQTHLDAIEAIKSGTIGDVRLFDSLNTQQVEEGNVRLDAALGGGPLLDMGVYCVNAARYFFRDEPVEVVAMHAHLDQPRFAEVPASTSAIMRFPGERLATFICGFAEAGTSYCRVVGTKGDLRLEPAFNFNARLQSFLTVEGKTTKSKSGPKDHIAPEIVYFSDCILNQRQPEPDGYEGLIDVQIMEAINESAADSHWVMVPSLKKRQRPEPEQQIDKPPFTEPGLVNAQSPSG